MLDSYTEINPYNSFYRGVRKFESALAIVVLEIPEVTCTASIDSRKQRKKNFRSYKMGILIKTVCHPNCP